MYSYLWWRMWSSKVCYFTYKLPKFASLFSSWTSPMFDLNHLLFQSLGLWCLSWICWCHCRCLWIWWGNQCYYFSPRRWSFLQIWRIGPRWRCNAKMLQRNQTFYAKSPTCYWCYFAWTITPHLQRLVPWHLPSWIRNTRIFEILTQLQQLASKTSRLWFLSLTYPLLYLLSWNKHIYYILWTLCSLQPWYFLNIVLTLELSLQISSANF